MITVPISLSNPALPAPVITNHTQSEHWAWLEWKVPTSQYPLPYSISNFTICYLLLSNTSSTTSTTNTTSSTTDHHGSQKSSSNSTSASTFSDISPQDLDPLSGNSSLDLGELCTPSDSLTIINRGGQRSANLTGLLDGEAYVVRVMYMSTEGWSSAWSHAVVMETSMGKQQVQTMQSKLV